MSSTSSQNKVRHDNILDYINLENLAKHGKEFVTFVIESKEEILNAFHAFSSEKTSTLCELSKRNAARDTMVAAVQDACIFISSIDDFFYFGKETNFKSIKDDIRKGKSQKLNQYLRKMNECLHRIELPYKHCTEKCNVAAKEFTELAEMHAYLQDEGKANKKRHRIIGGSFSAFLYGGAISATAVVGTAAVGVISLGVVPAVGLGLAAVGFGITGVTGTVITHVNASKCASNEAAFKATSVTFRKFVEHGKKLKDELNELGTEMKTYENTHITISEIDITDKDTLCSGLDRIRGVFEAQHFEISKVRDSLLALKNTIIQESQQWYA